MGKLYTRFHTKTAQKTLPFKAAHTYMAYIKEYPSPRSQPAHSSSRRLVYVVVNYLFQLIFVFLLFQIQKKTKEK